MSRVLKLLPELEGDEQLYVARLMKEMSDEQAEQFAHIYRQRRRNPTLTLGLALIGFAGFAGIHRFGLEQILMGLLYLFTAGLCFIGTIVDLFRYQGLTFEYNRKKADEVALLVARTFPTSSGDTDHLPPGEAAT